MVGKILPPIGIYIYIHTIGICTTYTTTFSGLFICTKNKLICFLFFRCTLKASKYSQVGWTGFIVEGSAQQLAPRVSECGTWALTCLVLQVGMAAVDQYYWTNYAPRLTILQAPSWGQSGGTKMKEPWVSTSSDYKGVSITLAHKFRIRKQNSLFSTNRAFQTF